MQSSRQSFLGILYIILGFVLFLLAAGELLLRFAVIVLALWLISYGMQMRGAGTFRSLYWSWKNKNNR